MKSNGMRKASVLLTTVCRPFGPPDDGNSVGAELFHAQVTRSQGMFSFRQVIRCWGLDYIAENISAHSVVLHYPSKKELVQELKTHHFDYVGINFVVSTLHILKRMVPLIRKYSPRAQIILGGYGTVLDEDALGGLGDLICRGEGISFMRRVLGDDELQSIRHPYAPIESPRFYSYSHKTKVAHITAGLGCPNGCDFCCTSHYFRRKYLPFIRSGEELYSTMIRMQKEAESKGDKLSGFIIIDEDFFLHEKRAREFLECVRMGGRAFSIMGFGSVKGLSRFTPEEIAEMGFDIIWIAFEGLQAGYKKLEGSELSELYMGLRAVGVSVLASMIIGFPYQDREVVLKEFDYLMTLRPALSQFLICFAFPGTPLYQFITKNDLFLPDYKSTEDYRSWDGFRMHMKHDKFTARDIESLQRKLYQKDFRQLGPSIVRILRIWFNAHKNLSNSTNPLLKSRSQMMKRYVREALGGIYPAIFFGPAKKTRREAKELYKEIILNIPEITLKERIFCWMTIPLAIWTRLTMALGLFQQPQLLRREYSGITSHSLEENGQDMPDACPQRVSYESAQKR